MGLSAVFFSTTSCKPENVCRREREGARICGAVAKEMYGIGLAYG